MWFARRSLALDGRRLAVADPSWMRAGPSYVWVYTLDPEGGTWVERQRIDVEEKVYSVALEGEVLLAGEHTFPLAQVSKVGAVEVFVLTGQGCSADDECTSGFCVDGVCCNEACGGNTSDDCLACAGSDTGLDDGVCGTVVAGVTCRAATGPCDVAEVCDGVATTCPDDETEADGMVCDDEDACTSDDVCQAGVCTGTGRCTSPPPPPPAAPMADSGCHVSSMPAPSREGPSRRAIAVLEGLLVACGLLWRGRRRRLEGRESDEARSR